MKLLLLIAAPIAVTLAAGTAVAQERVVHTTTVTTHDKTVHRDDNVAPRHGSHWKKVCSTRWSNYRKIRSCKNVRARW